MLFNLIHRPNSSESYDFQRECAHSLNLKTTILIPTRFLEDEQVTEKAKYDMTEYKDEIGLWIEPMSHHPNTQVWLLSEKEKRETVEYSINKYKEIFKCSPKVVGNYVMDSQMLKIVKDFCPEIIACIAGCFEEGVKVFHGCNNSWYLFSEGMSWNPWYPSKTHSARPAKDTNDWAGVVGIPHLCRDLVLGYEGRNDFFASHPANIQRGLANDGYIHEYDYNLVDQFRMQEDFNDGFSYYQIHVGPGWFHNNFNIIDSDDITRTLYKETLEYLVDLRTQGQLTDMYVSEFAEAYMNRVQIGNTDIGVGKDILFGSGKHYCWVYNTDYRVLVDTFQGGSIGDLRPYIGEYESFTGVDSDSLIMNSYPYVIQSQYRSGYKNHHEDGSRTTLLVTHSGETLDMCCYPTKIEDITKEKEITTLSLTPVKLTFNDGFEIDIRTKYNFVKGGIIEITREILSVSDVNAEFEFTEYVKACYGFTEYPENMKGIFFFADEEKIGDYQYQSTNYKLTDAKIVTASIPLIQTDMSLSYTDRKAESLEICDGHLFSPFFTLKLNYLLGGNDKEVKSCLKLQKTKM